MNFLSDWRLVARRAWSVRLAILAAVLGAAEVGVQLYAATRPTPYLAMGSALLSLLAALARLVAQPGMHDERV